MAHNSRYLWGTTKATKLRITKYLDFDMNSTTPDVPDDTKVRIYANASGELKVCSDATAWTTISVT